MTDTLLIILHTTNGYEVHVDREGLLVTLGLLFLVIFASVFFAIRAAK